MNRDISKMRKNYMHGYLLESNVDPHPMDQFKVWFDEASTAEILEPNLMVLSTVDKENKPSSRAILLKELTEEGFIFYTNYTSDKAIDIKSNANVSLNFLWVELERQVRISGKAQKISREKSEAYYQSRPRESQIGARVSYQSKVISNRETMDQRLQKVEKKYKNVDPIPLPEYWGGYIVMPTTVEFWQGRPSRLHDRLRYQKNRKKWNLERLSP